VDALSDVLDTAAAETSFSGAVRVDRGGEVLARAYGLADRAHVIANTVDTRFAIASGTKGLTALTVMSLVETGALDLGTTARSVLGADLPLVDDGVTVEHLLANRSGIGDYFDEDLGAPITDHVLAGPVHVLDSIEAHVPVLDGYPQKFPPGERFSYCNAGFVVLALIAERVSGVRFHDLVVERVCRPAGMTSTSFLRSDEPPGDAAIGYLDAEGLRTNVLHLPVLGGGDGGASSTVADVAALWSTLFDGGIVARRTVEEMTRPRSDVPRNEARYGLGLWLHATRAIAELDGYDPGISFRTSHEPATRTTLTIVSNTSEGAWPLAERLFDLVFG